MELYEKIRREYENGVGSILGVARKLGVHRRTVREAIESAIPPKRKRVTREATRMVRELVLFIHGVLEHDQQAPRKQRHTAQRVFERLRAEMPECAVSARSVRRAVQEWKQQRQLERSETYIGQHYEAGREAQVDWYEAYADIAGERSKLQVFCLRSMYSGAAYHRAYVRATQLAFLDAHVRAFEMFGGIWILDEILEERVISSRNRLTPRGVKRKMSNYPLRPPKRQRTRRIDFAKRTGSLSEQYWT